MNRFDAIEKIAYSDWVDGALLECVAIARPKTRIEGRMQGAQPQQKPSQQTVRRPKPVVAEVEKMQRAGRIEDAASSIERISGEFEVMNVRVAGGRWTPTQAQIAYHLGHFVNLVRSLPTDGVVLRQNWVDAYKVLTPTAAAQLTEIARIDDPFLSLGHVGRTVHVRSIIQRSDHAYEVSWVERETNATGTPDGEAYSGIFTVDTRTPHDADEIANNPLGLFITDFSWSRVR